VLTPVHHPRWSGWRYRAYDRLYAEADAVIALTSMEGRTLADLGVDPERITVTGIGPVLAERADPGSFLERHALKGPVVLFVGQHYRYKGFETLLESAPLVWQDVPEAEFVFIGPSVGDSDRVFERHRDPRIHRLGSVTLQEKTDAFAASDVFCMPSTQESFGGVYTEAWSFGKPVIGCPIPAVAEIIQEGVDGHLVDQSREPLAERLTALLRDPDTRSRLGAAGLHKVRSRYDWAVLAEITERAYATAVERAPG
jgi:glycosyltransferase involved in cell wall biosynthesis